MTHLCRAIGNFIAATAAIMGMGTTPSQAQPGIADQLAIIRACSAIGLDALLNDEKPIRSIASVRDARYQGKVEETDRARCRGGEKAVREMRTPWVDWSNYFGTGGPTSRSALRLRDERGITAALIDLEYQRMELIK